MIYIYNDIYIYILYIIKLFIYLYLQHICTKPHFKVLVFWSKSLAFHGESAGWSSHGTPEIFFDRPRKTAITSREGGGEGGLGRSWEAVDGH